MMNTADQEALSISAVERETEISKDVLRKWESRYGFPAPPRDAQGERNYPADRVDRLLLIKRLMDTGLRPSRIVAESAEKPHALALAKPLTEASASIGRMRDLTLGMLRHEDPAPARDRACCWPPCLAGVNYPGRPCCLTSECYRCLVVAVFRFSLNWLKAMGSLESSFQPLKGGFSGGCPARDAELSTAARQTRSK